MRHLILAILMVLLLSIVTQPIMAASDAEINNIIAQRTALTKQKPYTGVVPRSNEPSGYITVLRLWPEPNDMKIAIAALEGIVNREKPQLYIGMDKPLRWLEYYGGKIVIEPTEPDIYKVFEKFKGSVKGIVVYDFSLDALANVAITYAGVEDLIPATPELANTLSAKYGWKVVHDLRNRWTTRYEAYSWAYDNLFPKCSKYALTHYNHGFKNDVDPSGPSSDTNKTGFAVDYAVEFRMFTWHVPTEPSKEEMALAEKIMQSVAFETPIFGRSSSQKCYPEPSFVSWVAQFANLHIPAGMSNTSVLSGARVPPELLKQKPLTKVRDAGPDKIYIAITNSEHDNLENVLGGGMPWQRGTMGSDDPYRIWWADPWRGRVAIGWPIGPLAADLSPTTIAHFTTTATDNDCLMVALSGLCLSDTLTYGSAYPSIQDKLLDDYCKLTGDYMKRLGWTMAQPVGGPAEIMHYVKNIPELQGVMEGYGTHKGITPETADYTLNGVPVFHGMVESTAYTSRNHPIGEENLRKAKALAKDIETIKVTDRPAFVHVWTSGWDYGPTNIKMAADLLPSNYVIVRPDELAALYKKYKGKSAEIAVSTPKITPAGTVTETLNGSDGLIVDTGKIKVEIGWGKEPQAPVKRVMGVDGKWRCAGKIPQNTPTNTIIKSFACKKTKDTPTEKDYQLTYSYTMNDSSVFNIRAIAGCPYLIINNVSKEPNLPSWSFDQSIDFLPDTVYTDAESQPIDYKKDKALGSLPWSRWILLDKKEGSERDMIGVFTMAWADWVGDYVLCYQRKQPSTFFEFFYSRAGARTYAIAALDRNDDKAPLRIWKELNGK